MGIAPGCLNALSRDCVGSRGKKEEREREGKQEGE